MIVYNQMKDRDTGTFSVNSLLEKFEFYSREIEILFWVSMQLSINRGIPAL